MAALYAAYQVWLPLAPTGDEIYQVFALAILIGVLGIVAASFHPRPTRNAMVFAVVFLAGTLGVWFKIAKEYEYSFWGRQLRYSLLAGVLFYALVLVPSVGVWWLSRAIRERRHAT